MLKMSIIYCSLTEVTTERLAVALILFDENQVKYIFSEDKLKVAKKLLNKSKFAILNNEIFSYKRYFDKLSNKLSMFNYLEIENSLIHSSIHLNNTVQFQAPIFMNIDLNEDNIVLIAKKYLGLSSLTQANIESFHNNYLEFSRKVSKNVSLHYKLTKDRFDFLKFPVKVSFAGKNGNFVFGNTLISENQNEEMFYHKLTSIVNLNEKFKNEYQDYKHFIMTDLMNSSDKSDILNELTECSTIKVVDVQKVTLLKLAKELIDIKCVPLEKYFKN